MRPTLLLLLGGMLGLGACSGAHEPHHDPVVNSRPPTPSPQPPALNVPALLNLSIDELSGRLGPRLALPPGFVDPTQMLLARRPAQDSAALFRSRGLALVASYNQRSRRVSDLLLLGTNEEELMSRARLELGADGYLVLPVFQERHPTRLLGLRVLAIGPAQ